MGTPKTCTCIRTNSGILGTEENKRTNTAASNIIPPLPIPHCLLMSSNSSNTEQPRFHIVPVQVDNDEIKMHEEEEGEPPAWDQAMARISPHSTIVALAAHPLDMSAPREVINGLINNIRYQQEQSDDNIRGLQAAMAGQQGLIDDLMQCLAEAEGAVDLDRPEGFEDNNGRVHSLIPVRGGLEVVPKWIQKRNDGKVALRAGKEEEEPMYVTKLYANPNYLGDRPIRTMAPWL